MEARVSARLSSALPRGDSWRRRWLLAALVLVIVLVATEALSWLAILVSRPLLDEEIRTTRDILQEQTEMIRRLVAPDSSRLLALDPVLGWRYRAGHRDSTNTMNGQGVRSTRTYATQPPRGVIRVAAFGDSFVYGNEVGDSAAWPAQIERLYPNLEVANYGVGGYGVDQAYLRFCVEGTALSPRFVIIGFTTDDLRRVVNVYRRFVSNREIPLVKPRFVLDAGGRLVLVPNPVARPEDYERYVHSPRDIVALGANDQWYSAAIYRNPVYDYSATVRLLTGVWLRLQRRYFAPQRLVRHGEFNPSSIAFRIQLALFEQFAAAVRAAGAHPPVAILPDAGSVRSAPSGRRTRRGSLVRGLAARGLDYVDVTQAFVAPELRGDVNDWVMVGRHYSPAGNRIVARRLGRAILARARGPVSAQSGLSR